MHTWNSIEWLPICLGLSAAGLVLSWLTWRRKGFRRGVRAVAWSLLPLALYLTGSILLVGRIGSAIVQFASAFVFSPRTWAGVTLFILAGVIFLVSGGIPGIPLLSSSRKRAGKAGKKEVAQQPGSGAAVTPAQGNRTAPQVAAAPSAKPAKRGKQDAAGPGDDGLDPEITAILRRHGIS
jgi:hypothetical protein